MTEKKIKTRSRFTQVKAGFVFEVKREKLIVKNRI